MSVKIVNLRTERKRRERASESETAAENRARHGRTKAERRLDTLQRDEAARRHEGHRIEDPAAGAGRVEPDEDRSDPS
ncbi:MAG: DUF4169 family protein [Thalassobaculaceae bacterium]|nr:DUF4169 family protein [Thalassobaculaceae bacterium]